MDWHLVRFRVTLPAKKYLETLMITQPMQVTSAWPLSMAKRCNLFESRVALCFPRPPGPRSGSWEGPTGPLFILLF